jgi:hypothetical protein
MTSGNVCKLNVYYLFLFPGSGVANYLNVGEF